MAIPVHLLLILSTHLYYTEAAVSLAYCGQEYCHKYYKCCDLWNTLCCPMYMECCREGNKSYCCDSPYEKKASNQNEMRKLDISLFNKFQKLSWSDLE
uniref:Cysteine rich secreted protein n=1 Tax=Riptortus pedestris TaxID=329032 RepID=R4WD14_RIPPE|nr:cysteine rich secreted protein [Riptortus pedestris]